MEIKMGWLGKAVGGSLGFLIGGPIGAIAGIALGHQYDKNEEKIKSAAGVFSRQEKSQAIFFVTTFSLFAKMARADGRVSREEIDVIDNFIVHELGLDSESRNMAIKIFRAAKSSPEPYESLARQFYGEFRNRRDMLLTMVELLMRIALADNRFHVNEERMIRGVVNIFHISEQEYSRLRSVYLQSGDRYYAVLGCSRTDSDETIKKKYRKLVMEYHPDRVTAKGLPEEFAKVATEKFREIQEAYDFVMKERRAA